MTPLPIPPLVRDRLVEIARSAGLDCAARTMATARDAGELRDVAVELAGAWHLDAFRAVMRIITGKGLSAVALVNREAVVPWIAGGPRSSASDVVSVLVSYPYHAFSHQHWQMLFRVREALYLRGAFLASCERFSDRHQRDVWHLCVRAQNQPPRIVVVHLARGEDPFSDTTAKAVATRVVDCLAMSDGIPAEDLPRDQLRIDLTKNNR